MLHQERRFASGLPLLLTPDTLPYMAKHKGRKKGKSKRRRSKKLGRTPCGAITLVSGKYHRRFRKVSAAVRIARALGRHGKTVHAVFGRACKVTK
jgi:hypothetical protein